VAGALTLGRFAIRGYNSRRLYWDDLAHLAAFLVLLSHSVTNEATLNAEHSLAILKATKTTPQAELLRSYQHSHYLNTINIWWAVLAFTLVTFWVPIAGVLATCAHAKTVADYSE